MNLLLWIVAVLILASGLQRSSYAVSPKQAKLDSLLYHAYHKKDTIAIKNLLSAGANIYKEFEWGSLVIQAYYKDSTLFRFLMRNGVKITRRTPNGLSLLHFHSTDDREFGNGRSHLTSEELATLLRSKNDVNAVRSNGQTPLHDAASDGNFAFVRQLVEHGAKVNVRDTFGATPLHSVCRNRYKRIPKGWLTCSAGWEHEERERKKTLPGRKAIVKYLIEHGADVNAIDRRQNLPLHWAHDLCDEMVKYALPRGMRLDIINDENESVLHVCAQHSEDGTSVVALIGAGMDVNARGQFGSTPLHNTARRNRVEAAKLLLSAGADMTIKNEFGRSAYDEVVQVWNRPEIARLMGVGNGDPVIEETVDHAVPLKTEATDRPKTEIDEVMEEINRLKK